FAVESVRAVHPMPPAIHPATQYALLAARQSANQFRLTPTKSCNTKKLSASPSRDRGNAALAPGKRHADQVVVWQDGFVRSLPRRRGGVFAARHIERSEFAA